MDAKKTQIAQMTVYPSSSIKKTLQAINDGSVGTAIVVEEDAGCFLGVVTDGDIRRALLDGFGLDDVIESLVRKNSKYAKVGSSLQVINELFSEPIRILPLLDDNGRVADFAQLDRRVYLPVSEPFLGENELKYVTDCILTGWISSAGKYVQKFEEMMADFCGVQYGVATSNGTTALHLVLEALGIGPGDEVIVPSLTFIATANTVKYTGATPVFVDSDVSTWNLDPLQIESLVTNKTKAIIPVHLYGHPTDMDPIMEIADKYGLYVIEDCAEAHGALYKGRKVGSIGHASAFSFYGNKIVTTGEGGMVVTNDPHLHEKMLLLRSHGMTPERRYWHPVVGYNYRLTNLQAAIGVAQMEKIDKIIDFKRQIAEQYKAGLRGIKGITLPPEKEWAKNVYWLYSVLINEQFPMDRDRFMENLKSQGVDSRPIFPPMHIQPIYEKGQRLPVSEYISNTGVSLPSAVTLQPLEIDHIIKVIQDISKYGEKPNA